MGKENQHQLPISRRDFLKLVVASISGWGLERATKSLLYPAGLEEPIPDGYSYFLPLALKESSPPSISPLKGLGMGRSFGSPTELKNLGVQMTFNWAPTWEFCKEFAEYGIEYIPLIDGVNNPPDEEVRNFFEQNPEARLLLLCEPEFQNPVTLEEAIILLDHYVSLIGENRIIFGNVTALDDYYHWLEDFVNLYKSTHNGRKPPVLGYGAHAFYGDASQLGICPENWNANAFRAWLQSFVTKVHGWDSQAEVWFTEWGILYPSQGFPVGELMQTGVGWFEANEHPYFWYASRADGSQCPDCCCSLLDENFNLTELGEEYRALP